MKLIARNRINSLNWNWIEFLLQIVDDMKKYFFLSSVNFESLIFEQFNFFSFVFELRKKRKIVHLNKKKRKLCAENKRNAKRKQKKTTVQAKLVAIIVLDKHCYSYVCGK